MTSQAEAPSYFEERRAVEPEVLPQLVDRIIARIEKHKTVEGFTDGQIGLIIDTAHALLAPLPALLEITAPVIVFGDVHGQLNDLLRFLALSGRPPTAQWLFLGDYVDRGRKGLEVILFLLCHKIKYPERVHLLRGNHECQKTNRGYGFHREVTLKRSLALWLTINRKIFAELPLCASIGSRMLCMHGGISAEIKSWQALRELKKPASIVGCDSGIALDLMWADPCDGDVRFKPNLQRSTSVQFGRRAIHELCVALGISLVVRAHEVEARGFRFQHRQRLVTIFSAPNYCGTDGNSGSIMHVNDTNAIYFTTLTPIADESALPPELRAILASQRASSDAKTPQLGSRDPVSDSPIDLLAGGSMSALL